MTNAPDMSRTEAAGRRMMRHARVISVLLACVLIAVGLGIWALRPTAPGLASSQANQSNVAAPSAPADIAAGSTVPTFSLPALRSGQPTVDLAADRGKPVVLNFFAAWCHPCEAELPLIRQAWAKVGQRITFVGVDVNDNRAKALTLVDADKVGYQLASDSRGSVAVRYALVNLPDTVFIDAHGKVVHTQVGQLTPKVLETWLTRLGG